MKLFAQFDEKGNLMSLIKKSDPNMIIPDEYEEITDPQLKRLALLNKVRKSFDANGKGWIVPVE